MEKLTLHPLSAQDLPRYFALQWEYLCRDLFTDSDTREDRDYFRSSEYRGEVSRRLQNGSLLLLAYRQEETEVGYAQLLFESRGVRVMEFWILPEHRRHGLGRAAWEATEACIPKEKFPRITLEAATKEADSFWQAVGFAKTKQEIMEKIRN